MQNSRKIQDISEVPFPIVADEDLQRLRGFIEEIHREMESGLKSPNLKRKKQSKKLKPRKKRKKPVDERLIDLPFHF